MAEKLHIQPEAPKQDPEIHRSGEHHVSKKEHHPRSQESQPDRGEQLAASREAVERQAKSSQELTNLDRSTEHKQPATPPPTRELQDMAKDRLLRTIRRQLPGPERVLSKFVHARPVEVLSSAGEKTVARPYGLLGGGLAAFLGSALTFYMAKHYGFRYNLLLFFTFFIAGYIVATVIEVIVRALRHSK